MHRRLLEIGSQVSTCRCLYKPYRYTYICIQTYKCSYVPFSQRDFRYANIKVCTRTNEKNTLKLFWKKQK